MEVIDDLYKQVCKIAEETDTRGLIREHAIRELSQRFYDCVDCEDNPNNPRANTDWREAESIVDQRLDNLLHEYVSWVASQIRPESNSFNGDDTVRKFLGNVNLIDLILGGEIANLGRQQIEGKLPHPPYGSIRID